MGVITGKKGNFQQVEKDGIESEYLQSISNILGCLGIQAVVLEVKTL
jgi:hypothetical protein